MKIIIAKIWLYNFAEKTGRKKNACNVYSKLL